MTPHSSRTVLGFVALVGVSSCSDGSDARPTATDLTAVSGGAAGASGPAGASGALNGTGGTTGGGASGTGGSAALDAPDDEPALLAFLNAKAYAGWAKELDFHPSTGPHGDGVRVYYSPKAAAAVMSGAMTLPAGAATVKELTSSGSLYGHAVWVKVQDASDSGDGFFWYERIAQGGGVFNVYGNARGSGDCVGCHSTGKDFNLSVTPFK